MKNHNTLSGQTLALRASLCLCLLAMATQVTATDVQFTATFQAPTCQVSAPPVIDFGTVQSSDIKNGGSQEKPLTITLSQCAGFIGAVQQRGVKVSGGGNSASGDLV
ncbi:fimbrial protein, partial [Yersinia massiliensis]|uniref:fimbrial protein n=1 Tax=Yersinia massiliensis TaxID=419257 RepID=UPI0028D6C46E